MGDFSEHVLFGFLMAAVLSYFLKDLLSLEMVEIVAGSTAVFLGSVLPDIDHKNSYVHRSVRAFSSLSLAFLLAYSVPFETPVKYAVGMLAFLLVYGLFRATRIQHRGITHSVWFLISVTSIGVIIGVYTLYSALPGMALGVGMLSHLVLDNELN